MEFIKPIVDFSPALAAGVFCTIVVVVILLKFFGFSGIGDRSKLIDDDKIKAMTTGVDAIKGQLGVIDQRITKVEHEVTTRATRDEVHRLELEFARMTGEIRAQAMTIQSTANAVVRIEDYMYVAAAGHKASKSA